MSVADRVPAANVTLPVAGLCCGLLGWWLLTGPGPVAPFVLPSPFSVAERLLTRPGLYAESALATLAKVLVGGGVGVLGGFLVAVVVSRSDLLGRALYPYLVAARVLPKVAVAPLLLVYVGLGFGAAVVLVALVAFFPMVVSTAAGLDRAPERHHDLLRSVDAGALRGFLTVDLPHAHPDVFAGLKQSVTLSVVGATVAEWVVATEGLGYLVLVASETVQTDVMVAAIAVLVGLGLCLYGVVVLCQRAVVRRFPLE